MSWLSALGQSCCANSLSVVACFILSWLRCFYKYNCKCSTHFLILQCSFVGVCSVQCIFPPTSSLFTCMSFCSAPVLHFLRLRLLLPFVKGVRVTSIREGCLCLLLCRLSLLSLEPCRNSRGETACPTFFTSGGVCCPLFKV